ncbi:MATH domain containing protein [Aphelenchoides avenae]|nr:MATH domain containing protein [Aphelenchus avenae]
MDDQKAGGSTESLLFAAASEAAACGDADGAAGAAGGRESSQGSGASSPGRSNSLFHSSRTTTDESLPRRSGSREAYDATTDDTRHAFDVDDFDDPEFEWPVSSVGIQTDYDEDFPPLEYVRVPPPALQPDSPGQQNPPVMTIVPPTTTSNEGTATTSCSASDGTLQLVIQNFRNMTDTVRGPSKYIQNVPWRIMVMPRQHVVQKKGTQKCLGFFLQCCPEAYSESWSCQAAAELRLISQKQGVANFTRKTNHVYTAKENDWGYSCFMTWADILDESQGYIKDDRVVLEVSVKAEPPKNILTHKEFEKKIQDYKRIADIQCERGLIDKAIECNAQALKFCKDKDPHCKADLEAQKAHLIEMKLKQSIERIEKGGDPTKTDDENANLNALRNAIGSTTRASTKQKAIKSSKDQSSDVVNKNARAVTPPSKTRAATPPGLPAPPKMPTANNNSNSALNRLNPRSKSGGRTTGFGVRSKGKELKSLSPASEVEKENNTNNKALVTGGQFNKKLLEGTKTETETTNNTATKGFISPQLASDIEEFKALRKKTDAAAAALEKAADGLPLKRHQLIQKVKEELANVSVRQNAKNDGQLAPPPSRNATTQSSLRKSSKKSSTGSVQKSEFSCQTEFVSHRTTDTTKSNHTTNTLSGVDLDSSGSPPPPTKQRKKAVAKKTATGQRTAARPARPEDSDNSDEAKISEAERALANFPPLLRPDGTGKVMLTIRERSLPPKL